MVGELELRAAEAWAAMTRKPSILSSITGEGLPMPTDVALDFVQNVTGDRDDALTAILVAAADWLAGEKPNPSLRGEVYAACIEVSESVCEYIRCEAFGMADTFAGHIRQTCELAFANAPTRSIERRHAHDWDMWAQKANDVIARGRTLVALAYPV